jgi:hypothetical protein
MKPNPYLKHYAKICSKWVIKSNIKYKTTKLTRESVRETLYDLGLGK